MTAKRQTEATRAREAVEKHGYAIVRGVIDDALVQEARQHLRWLDERFPGESRERLGLTRVANDPFWVRLVGDDRLLDVAEAFIGPDITLLLTHYVTKEPGPAKPVFWHTEGNQWPIDPNRLVTLWLVLDDSDAKSGCMRVIRDSHTVESTEPPVHTETISLVNVLVEDSQVDMSKAEDAVVSAGDLTVHHPNVIHGFYSNETKQRRSGLIIRYIPSDVCITHSPWPSAFLLRGGAAAGINDYMPRPRFVAGEHMPFAGYEDWV